MGSNQNPRKSPTHRAPLRDLCTMLRLLPKTLDPRIDFAGENPELLLALASTRPAARLPASRHRRAGLASRLCPTG